MPSLSPRRKWLKEQPDFAVDDVVLEVDPNASRGAWRLGRVTAIHPGTDNHVRTVTVRFADKELKRPVVRLCRLEWADKTGSDAIEKA